MATPKLMAMKNMEPKSSTCAILADRHSALAEGVRGLLETAFKTVYLVADTPSLREGASRLRPALVVLDMSLGSHGSSRLVQEIGELSPVTRVLILTVHDDATVARIVLGAGAHGVVLKRCIGKDLMQAVDAVLQGDKYVSPDFGVSASMH